MGVFTVFNDLMIRARPHQQRDGQEQQSQPAEFHVLRVFGKFLESRLKDCAELKAHEHLCADDENASLVECGLDLVFELCHLFTPRLTSPYPSTSSPGKAFARPG